MCIFRAPCDFFGLCESSFLYLKKWEVFDEGPFFREFVAVVMAYMKKIVFFTIVYDIVRRMSVIMNLFYTRYASDT